MIEIPCNSNVSRDNEGHACNLPEQCIPNRWDELKKDDFIESVNSRRNEIENLCYEIERLDKTSVDNDCVDNIVQSVCDIFISSAQSTFGSKRCKPRSFKKNYFKKPWFTSECKYARRNYNTAKRLYKKYGNIVFKENLYEKEKVYMRKLKTAKLNHRRSV